MSKFGTILDILLFIYDKLMTKIIYYCIKKLESQGIDNQVFKSRRMVVNLNHQSRKRQQTYNPINFFIYSKKISLKYTFGMVFELYLISKVFQKS
jgi:hypothetical protein